MKKILLAVLAAALFVAPVFAEDDDFITVKVDGNIFVQGGAKGYAKDEAKGVFKRSYEKGTDAIYAVSVNFSKDFSNGGTAVLNLKGGNGNASGLFGGNDATHDTDSSYVRITELSYKQPILSDWATIKFGRIGTIGGENNVAGSADKQFINPMFTGEATKIGPDNGDEGDAYGVQVSVSPSPYFDLAYQYAAPGDSDAAQLDKDGWNAVQLTLKPVETGNYRFLYWASNLQKEDNKGEKAGLSGFSVSADQEIISGISLFGRYGISLALEGTLTSYDAEFNAAETEIIGVTTSRDAKQAWSFGVQFSGLLWNREGDFAGLAAGQKTYEDFKYDGEKSLTPSDYIAELYYNIKVNDFVSISPSLQYIQHSNLYQINVIDGTDVDNVVANYYAPKSEFAFAIRTHISF